MSPTVCFADFWSKVLTLIDLPKLSSAAVGDIHVCSMVCYDNDVDWNINAIKQLVGNQSAWLTSSGVPESARRQMAVRHVDGTATGADNPAFAGKDMPEGSSDLPVGSMDHTVPVKVLRAAAFGLQAAQASLARLTTAELVRRDTGAAALDRSTSNGDISSYSAYMAHDSLGGGSAFAGGLHQSHALRTGALLDMNDTMVVRAAGALVAWLGASGVLGPNLSGASMNTSTLHGGAPAPKRARHTAVEAAGLVVLPGTIRTLSLGMHMTVDPVTFAALQVFAPASAGSAAAGAAGSSAGPALAAAQFAGRAGLKEGFSLCGVLDRTCSVPGAKLLRDWLRRPLLDTAAIQHRHDAVAFLLTARQQAPECWRDLRRAMGRCKDIPRAISRLDTAKAAPGDWWALEQTLIGAGRAQELLVQLMLGVRVPKHLFAPGTYQHGMQADGKAWDPFDEADPPSAQAPALLRSFLSLAGPGSPLSGLLALMQQVIDWEASREAKTRIVVQAGLDPTLDEYRRVYAELPTLLAQHTVSEAGRYPTLVNPLLHYVPQLGIVLMLAKGENGLAAPNSSASSATHGPGTAMSHTGYTPKPLRPAVAGGIFGPEGGPPGQAGQQGQGHVPMELLAARLYETDVDFVCKTPLCHELDAYFGDLATAISNLEASILRQCEDKVLQQHSAQLHELAAALAQLDVLTSLAEASGDYGWARPVLVQEPILLAKNAVHPLQAIALQNGSGGGAGSSGAVGTGQATFVPNDIALAPPKPQAGGQGRYSTGTGPIAILTGPNGSGKSVYLKLCGILPLLAQCGCFVPAEKCIMGPVDRLFTRIASLESATVQASSFAIDCQQLSAMLRHATPYSLCLVDELGKGTNSVDGVSLLAASIRALLRVGGGAGGEQDCCPPRTLIATHFREVFDLGLLTLPRAGDVLGQEGRDGQEAEDALDRLPPRGVSFFKMEVMLHKQARAAGQGGMGAGQPAHEEAEEDMDVVVPLFKLKPGRADNSYGLACARKAGVGSHVLSRAQEVTSALLAGKAVSCPPVWHAQPGGSTGSVHAMATPAVRAQQGQAKIARIAAELLQSLVLQGTGQDSESASAARAAGHSVGGATDSPSFPSDREIKASRLMLAVQEYKAFMQLQAAR